MAQQGRTPWTWVPTLYFTDAVPYVMLTLLCLIYFKRTGISHTEITCMGSMVLLPWIFRSVIAESRLMRRGPRNFVLLGQLLIAFGCLGLYYTAGSWYKSTSLAMFLLISIGFVLHTSAAQIFYHSLGKNQGKEFEVTRNSSYRLGTLSAAGILVMFVGGLETLHGKITSSWSTLFLLLAGCFIASLIYHAIFLPRGVNGQIEEPKESMTERLKNRTDGLLATFQQMTEQKGTTQALLFFLFYPLPQAFLSSILPLFLLDPQSRAGAALSTQELGLCLGTIGIIALSAGSILGIKTVKNEGLTTHFRSMALAMSFPILGYLLISLLQIQSFVLISSFVFLERFCYGYGFTGYVRFIRFFCAGKAHYYTWCSIYTALGFILPGFIAGYLQEHMGYPVFFVCILGTGIVSMFVTSRILKIIHKPIQV